MLSPTFVRSPRLEFLFFPSFAERKKFVQKVSKEEKAEPPRVKSYSRVLAALLICSIFRQANNKKYLKKAEPPTI
jgi:hypothetical protein